MKKKAKKATTKPGLHNAKKTEGRVKVLMAMEYLGCKVYVRMVDLELFFWDVVIDGELYSNYIVITLAKGDDKLSDKIISEATQMCYAGAAATVDTVKGIELSEEDKQNVELFEKAREKAQKTIN